MKNFFLYMTLLLAIFCLEACSPEANEEPEIISPGTVGVTCHLGIVASSATDASSATRADYSDTHMVAGELMKNWFVVIVDANRKIVDVVKNDSYASTETERATDSFWERLTPGTYTFYAFANIQPSELGLEGKQKGDVIDDNYLETLKYSVKIPSITFTDHWSDYEHDYFPTGIPMSNKQVVTITAQSKSVSLEVVRMVAKMQLRITNTTSHDITIKGVTLSDVTPNVADNLMLLPASDATDDNGTVHVSAPNLAIGESQKQVAAYASQATSSGHDYIVLRNGGQKNICFYVNESAATAENKYFVLQLKTSDDTNTEVNHRYAMLDWRQICRNDYRVVPISLEDYAIEWKVEAFSPIGVLPAVEDDGENLTIRFDYYGEFHIIPSVKQLSTGQVVDSWDVSNKKCEEIISTPSGAYGIFDIPPYWSVSGNRIEGEMGNRSGTSIYKISMDVTKPDGAKLTLARKVRFVMNPVHF